LYSSFNPSLPPEINRSIEEGTNDPTKEEGEERKESFGPNGGR
jgi:hypothetical protein